MKEFEIESKVINNSTQEQITNPLEAQNTNPVVASNSVTPSQSGSGQSVGMGATMSANELLSKPQSQSQTPEPIPNPEVDLAKAALEVRSNSLVQEEFRNPSSTSIANQDISWYNQGVALIEAGKYAEALSCFDRALPSFSDDDEMVIRILNGRGNAFYYLENYPACVESYHQAMLIKPEEVRGKTLYNMGTAYAEMERYQDAVKCFEQAIPRGLSKDEIKRTKDQIRRCNILIKEQNKKKR